MAANIMTEPKFGKSNIAQKLFTVSDALLDEKLDNFRKNSEWLAKNKESLRKEYGGQYIAVHEERICFAEKNPMKLLKQVRSKYGDHQDVVVSFIGKEKVKFLL